jgi:hypothetical protein
MPIIITWLGRSNVLHFKVLVHRMSTWSMYVFMTIKYVLVVISDRSTSIASMIRIFSISWKQGWRSTTWFVIYVYILKELAVLRQLLYIGSCKDMAGQLTLVSWSGFLVCLFNRLYRPVANCGIIIL